MIGRSHHDMGELPDGRVEPSEHDYAERERRVDALMMLLTGVVDRQACCAGARRSRRLSWCNPAEVPIAL